MVLQQTTESFLLALENAFWHFGGVPQRLVLDNLENAVTKADWYDPEINPKVRSFAQHYGIALMPTRPYTPRHKGKVERGVDYVQENALKGRLFAGLAEQNTFLLTWEQTVADTRIHGTTKQQVSKLFDTVKRAALQPLPRRFLFSGRTTPGASGRPRRGGAGLLLGATGVSEAIGVGALGRSVGADLQ